MHQAVKDFIVNVRKELPHKFRFRSVLEVGSKSINGSPRKYFWFCHYFGIDLSNGKGVNYVGRLSRLYYQGMFTNHSFQVVISTEALEHDKEWDISLGIMYNVLKPNGLMIITCAAPDRQPHGISNSNPSDSPDTNDWYRNISTTDFKSVLPSHLFSHYILMYGRGKNDLYFYGIKKEIRTLAFGTSYDPK
jgi:SAM-dependent methyltransferase